MMRIERRYSWSGLGPGVVAAVMLASGGLAVAGGGPGADQDSGVQVRYTVKELLSPCVEGDADARWGEELLQGCNQYLRGLSDAYLVMEAPAPDKVCFPQGAGRVDRIRRAFVKWATVHPEHHDWPAAKGVLTAVRETIPCPGEEPAARP